MNRIINLLKCLKKAFWGIPEDGSGYRKKTKLLMDKWCLRYTETIIYCNIFLDIARKNDYPLAPLVLGLVLEPQTESSLRQSLMMSHGDFSILIQSPCPSFRQTVPGLRASAREKALHCATNGPFISLIAFSIARQLWPVCPQTRHMLFMSLISMPPRMLYQRYLERTNEQPHQRIGIG